MAGEGLGFRVEGYQKNWTLGEGQPLCKCAQLPHWCHFFVFKNFVPVLPIQRDLVVTQDSCLTVVLLHFIYQHHSLFLSFYFFLFLQAPPPKFSPNSHKCTLAPEVFLEIFLREKESDSRSGDNLLSPLRGGPSLSRRKTSRKFSGTKVAQMSLLAG